MSRIQIDGRVVGEGQPVFIVAEMSANHGKDFDTAAKIIEAAAKVGAEAIKLQTYTPDTMTIRCDNSFFRIKGTVWEGEVLYDLYERAYTPWDWQPRLKSLANGLGLSLFSTPFDHTAVDFLEDMGVPCYKVASFELVDLELISRVAQTGKPLILSTGMATLEEIEEAVQTAREAGANQIALLKCTSAYPAPAQEINLRAMPHLAETFGVAVGLSDHTLGIAVPVAAVALGACIIEKHLTLSRSMPGPDSAFSLEPQEFRSMVEAVRTAERALGSVRYGVTETESASRVFRRSLFVVQGVKSGQLFTEENVRSIRPGHGLRPKHLRDVLGRRAAADIAAGTPLAWNLVS